MPSELILPDAGRWQTSQINLNTLTASCSSEIQAAHGINGRKANIQTKRSMPVEWPPIEAGVCHVYRGKSSVGSGQAECQD